jgi:type I restriction enzyme S subunit
MTIEFESENKLQLLMRQARVNRIPEGWSLLTVGESCSIRNDLRKPISVEVRTSMKGEYPYYGPTGLLDFIDEYRLDEKYALIGEDGDHFLKFSTWPQTQIVDGKFNVNNHAHVIESSSLCTADWFYLYFKHRDITNFITRQGAGRFKLNKENLQRLPILIPPIAEQLEISRFLKSWESAIALTEKLISAKRRLKQGLMQKVLEGNCQFQEFRNKKWKLQRLGNFFEEKCEVNKDGLVSLILSCTKSRGIMRQSERFGKRLASSNLSRYKIVRAGDLVYDPMLLWDGSIGFLQDDSIGVVSPAYATFKANEQVGNRDFFWVLFKSRHMFYKYGVISQGTNRRRRKAQSKDFLNLEILLPTSLEEQQKIGALFRNLDQEIGLLQRQVKLLQRQKRGLMQKLLTGEILIPIPDDAA